MKQQRILRTIAVLTALFAIPVFSYAKEEKITDVVDTVSKAIVNIRTEEISSRNSDRRSHDFFKKFFSQEGEGEVEASENIGAGVVLDPKGIIVTNEHLISKAVTIRVKFSNRQEYEASVLAADPELDIALLKVEAKGDLPCLQPRTRNVRVGERTIVIGNPYNLNTSVTFGMVSAFRKNVKINDRIYATLVQTDAAINPGNSGGALLDWEGNLLGIVTAVYEEGRGIGFAIPIDEVMSMVSEFVERADKRPLLGIFLEKRSDDEGQYLLVNHTIPGSPAAEYGIRAGDRIVELDNKKVREGMKFQNIFRKASLTGKSQIKVIRGHETLTLNIEKSENYVPAPLDENLCGVRLSNIEGYAKLKFKLRQKSGVVVTKVLRDGIGEKYGLRPGDVVVRINNKEVLDKRDFQLLMVEGLRRNYILYQVKRNETLFFLPIKLDTLL
jgi:serine protease Do